MQVILSPAKTLDFDSTLPYKKSTQPLFLSETKKLITILKKNSAADLGKLMSISVTLAELNHKRYKAWKTPFTEKNARPAIFTFNGAVYRGFDWFAYKKADFERLQKTVRIISGLHGLLRPFDLIQAYRLEMGTKLKNPKGKDLYDFWKELVTAQLNKECKDMLINCASKEYFSAVDFGKLKCKVITPVFKNKKAGSYKVIGIFAKKARGMYADFVARTNPKSLADLKKFKRDGYRCDAKSSSAEELVFLKG